MKVRELSQFAITHGLTGEIESDRSDKEDAAVERNLDAEVIFKIYGLTSDEFGVYLTFVDSKNGSEGYFGIVDGSIACTLLEEAGIPIPVTS